MKPTVLNQPFAHYATLLSAVLVLASPLARAKSATELPSAAKPADSVAKGNPSAAVEPPVIRSLSATPDTITAGAAAKLRWSAPGATSVTITADNGSDPGKVSGSNLIVRPTSTTTYTLTAVNAAGQTVRTITVPVLDAAPSLPIGVFTGPATPALSKYRR